MSADFLIASLLRVAKQDLDDARLLAKTGSRNAVYLCEQAAEKIIRAVLTSESKHAGIKHQLDQMVDLIPDENPIKPALRAVEHLAAYATSYRYPTATGRVKQSPNPSGLNADIDNVNAALIQIAAAFGVELEKPHAPAAKILPIRR